MIIQQINLQIDYEAKIKLEIVGNNTYLPKFLTDNMYKYKEWFQVLNNPKIVLTDTCFDKYNVILIRCRLLIL